MPTGFTAAIEKGISFREFALRCSKGLTVMMVMHEEPIDKPIPDEFLPSEYYARELAKYREALSDLEKMSDEEVARAAKKDYDEKLEQHVGWIRKKTALKGKYLHMLDQVKRWTPPTEDHEYLKKFMIDQIEESIRFDCGIYKDFEPKHMSAQEWKEKQKKDLIWKIDNYDKEDKKEKYNMAYVTKWVRELKASLPEEGK